MKRVLLTGGTGFIGANLARRLLRDGHELHLLVRPGYEPWRIEEIREDLSLHEVDLVNSGKLADIVAGIRPEWIFHLAVYGAYPAQSDMRHMVQTNIIGTANLVEASLKTGFEAFVNTGTSSEYGFKDHAPSETECLEPNSNYAVTKASATLFCRSIAQGRNAHLPTLRLYSTYGPYEEPTRLFPTLIRHGLKGELPPLVDADAAHDYVYIDDVISAYLLAASRPDQEPGAVYNVGTGTQVSMRTVVDLAQRVLGIKAHPEWGSMPGRNWDTSMWVADSRKIRDVLGWRPRCSLEEGFRKMADWSRSHASTRVS
jgi:UDP-glucose 4-epimerase